MANFFKGIIVGLGGIAPGLSGSVLLIIFGLYRKCLDALGTIFRDFRKKVGFLLPLVAGMGVGVLLFSKILDFLLTNHEVPTRFCFLGLILGTIAEGGLGREILISRGLGGAAKSLVTSPICVILLVISIVSVAAPLIREYRGKKKSK